jgi:hypothetical protein
MEFFRSVVAAMQTAGLDVNYEHSYGTRRGAGYIVIGRHARITVSWRLRTYFVAGIRFTKMQQAEVSQYIITQLPRLMEQADETARKLMTESELRPIRLALRELGVTDSSDRVVPAHQREALSILLLYARVKKLGLEYDRFTILQCILDNPDNRLPLDIYCDWLSDNGREADSMKLRNARAETEEM